MLPRMSGGIHGPLIPYGPIISGGNPWKPSLQKENIAHHETCARTCTHTHACHTHARTYMYMRMHTRTHTHACTHTHAPTPTHVHTHTHHTHTHAHTHAHIQGYENRRMQMKIVVASHPDYIRSMYSKNVLDVFVVVEQQTAHYYKLHTITNYTYIYMYISELCLHSYIRYV